MFEDALTDRLAAFVQDVGIKVVAADLPEPTFLPGLDVRFGVVVVDEARLSYPGDILHEAGHVAVSAPEEREQARLAPTLGDEIAAIAWSYAAICRLGIDPAIVFHDGGYRGGSRAFIQNFSTGRYVGVPLLQLYDLTFEPRFAAAHGVKPYPHMLAWVR
ncbi:MAG TPA: hypothetical protein VHG27_00720 [Xanthobacteraceae bacterium]|nr:hypothetical protein [Xanthobacteraceae bacterium]